MQEVIGWIVFGFGMGGATGAMLAFERWENVQHYKIDGLQAKIDWLMLEYCPQEITKEQFDNWARYQAPAEAAEMEALLDRIKRGNKRHPIEDLERVLNEMEQSS